MADDVEHVSVAVRDDFIARQTRASPVAALAELIWNSLDADASNVRIEFAYDDLAGGMSKIHVYDDGDGFSRDEAKALFGNLGGSWKRRHRATKRNGRAIHGQEGRGRYKAFALGKSVEWNVCYAGPDGSRTFRIVLLDADLTDVSVGPENLTPDRDTGVVVTVGDLRHDYKVFGSPDGLQELTETFALYLENYKDARVIVAGERIDPAKAIATRHNRPLQSVLVDDVEYPVELEIVEWKRETKRTLYLCSSTGFPLDQVETRFHVPGYAFSAYLKSKYVDVLHEADAISLSEMDAPLTKTIEEARAAIKDYFRDRAAAQARSLVDEWKEADVYPYRGEPEGPLERAERQVFDIVAVQVQKISPDVGVGSAKAKAFHLRMLRSAIERGPEELQTILREVLDLPPRQQKELAALLQETTLSSIITAAKTVADRPNFTKILAENTWVFGEEYNLWVSDRGLRHVLEKHRSHLDPDISIDEPIKIIGKKRGIVDLMFSRVARRHRADDIEHMIVELKAPKVVIGAEEIVQTKKYEIAVTSDERFNTVPGLRWHFWIVSNAYDDYTRSEIEGGPDAERRLISRRKNSSVGIKTWGEIITENRARLQFFQEHLRHSADESAAIKYLQERHSQFLEGVIEVDDEAQEPAAPAA
jgi:Histidine kinase-, DNA gyrase B-, and HSP90-like ATPase